MKIQLIALSAATLALGVACVDGYDYSNVDDSRFATLGPRAVAEGAIRADFPGFVQTQGEGRIDTFNESNFSEVIVTRDEGNRQAMGIVILNEGDFNNPIFTDVGRVTRFSFDQPVDQVERPISMSVIACGGDPSSEWFDEPAQDFEVSVEAGDQPMDRVVTISTSLEGDRGEMDTNLLLTR